MRTETIQERLEALFRTELGHTTVAVEQEKWPTLPLVPRFRFGYMPPVPLTSDRDQFVVTFSPDLIDAVTSWLDDDAFEVYMDALEAFVAGHLMLPDEPSDEVMRHVEDELFDKAPEALRFMGEVEARAIDSGVVVRL